MLFKGFDHPGVLQPEGAGVRAEPFGAARVFEHLERGLGLSPTRPVDHTEAALAELLRQLPVP
jgi:hypothetical protein